MRGAFLPAARVVADESAPLLHKGASKKSGKAFFASGVLRTGGAACVALALIAVCGVAVRTTKGDFFSLGAPLSSRDASPLGIGWTTVSGVADPVLTSDRGVLAGECDPDSCPYATPGSGHYSYVDNCLGGGSGCMPDSTTTGCRICTIYGDAGQFPLWFPQCPRCVCDAYGIDDPNSMCVRVREEDALARETTAYTHHTTLTPTTSEGVDPSDLDETSFDLNEFDHSAESTPQTPTIGEYRPVPATGAPDGDNIIVVTDTGLPVEVHDGTDDPVVTEDGGNEESPDTDGTPTSVIPTAASVNDTSATTDTEDTRLYSASQFTAGEMLEKVERAREWLATLNAQFDAVTGDDAKASAKLEIETAKAALAVSTAVHQNAAAIATAFEELSAAKKLELSSTAALENAVATQGSDPNAVDIDATVAKLDAARKRVTTAQENVDKLKSAKNALSESSTDTAQDTAFFVLQQAVNTAKESVDAAGGAVASAEGTPQKIDALHKIVNSSNATREEIDAAGLKIADLKTQLVAERATRSGALIDALRATQSPESKVLAKAIEEHAEAVDGIAAEIAAQEALIAKHANATRMVEELKLALANAKSNDPVDDAQVDGLNDALSNANAQVIATATKGAEEIISQLREDLQAARAAEGTIVDQAVNALTPALDDMTSALVTVKTQRQEQETAEAHKASLEAQIERSTADGNSTELDELQLKLNEAIARIQALEVLFASMTSVSSGDTETMVSDPGPENDPSEEPSKNVNYDGGNVTETGKFLDGTVNQTVSVIEITDPKTGEKSQIVEITAPTETTCADRAACEARANELGLRLGGGGFAFVGDFGTKGCYTYESGTFKGSAYYGTGGAPDEMATDVASPKERVTCKAVTVTSKSQAMCTLQSDCESRAEHLGLKLGGGGFEFAGDFSTKGCYTYESGTFEGHAYFGVGGSPDEIAADVASPKERVTCEVVVTAVYVGDQPPITHPVPEEAPVLAPDEEGDPPVLLPSEEEIITDPEVPSALEHQTLAEETAHTKTAELAATLPTPPSVINPNENYRAYSSVWQNQIRGADCNQGMLDSNSAWCAKYNLAGEFYVVDAGEVVELVGVATQRRRASPQMVTKYTVSVAEKPNGPWRKIDGGRTFQGNTAMTDAKAARLFNQGAVHARYIKFEIVEWSGGHMSMRAGLIGVEIEHGDYEFNPNDHYRLASSDYGGNPKGTGCNMGMLDSVKGWCAQLNRAGEWHQMDLGYPQTVSGVVTQARVGSETAYWTQMVTEYKVSVKNATDEEFQYVDEQHVFQGNTAVGDGRVQQRFKNPVAARFVKIEVVEYVHHVTMRVGVLLIPSESDPTDVELNPNDNYRFMSSTWDNDRQGVRWNRGMLDSPQAWIPQYKTLGEWYGIDAGKVATITGVVLQRRQYDHTYQYVKKFKVLTSTKKDGPYKYVDDGYEFTGCSAETDGRVAARFARPVTDTRFVKIEITDFNSWPSLRAGLLELPSPTESNEVELNVNENYRSASSVYQNKGKGLWYNNGMLDSASAWISNYNRAGEWYSIDAGEVRKVLGVVTQPRADALYQMVTEYKVQVANATDGPWQYVDDGYVFDGNVAATNGRVTRRFAQGAVVCRFVRIEVVKYNSHMSLRAGVLVAKDTSPPKFVIRNPNNNHRVASSTHKNEAPGTGLNQGMLYSTASWSASRAVAGEWYTMEVAGRGGRDATDVYGIAMQSRAPTSQQRVELFKVSYSLTADFAESHPVDNGFVFTGNVAYGDGVALVPFKQSVRAKFLKIEIVKYNEYPSMRVGYLEAVGDGSSDDSSGQEQLTEILDPNDSYRFVSSAHADVLPGLNFQNSALTSPVSWSAKYNVAGEWLTIDAGELTQVAGVVTLPRKDSAQSVTRYKVLVSDKKDGLYTYVDGGYEFVGNTAPHASDSQVARMFAEPVYTRFVRIEVVAWIGHISMRAGLVVVPETDPETHVTINPNENYRTSSSVYEGGVQGAWYNRGSLDSNSGWAAKYARLGEWHQIDLGSNHALNVSGIVSQNRRDSPWQFVSKYKVLVSHDADGPWEYVDEQFVFDGATSRGDGRVVRKFSQPVAARHVRVEVAEFGGGHPAGRFGVLIKPNEADVDPGDPSKLKPKFETLNPSDHHRFASSVWAGDAAGTGHMRGMLGSQQAWVAQLRVPTDEWYVIDCGEVRTVGGVVTQARHDTPHHGQMVTSYKVQFGHARVGPWYDVDDGNVFKGNTAIGYGTRPLNQNEVSNEFQNPVDARFIRILPQTVNGFVSMRVGLLVVPNGSVVSAVHRE